jgi:hypothetical protein
MKPYKSSAAVKHEASRCVTTDAAAGDDSDVESDATLAATGRVTDRRWAPKRGTGA